MTSTDVIFEEKFSYVCIIKLLEPGGVLECKCNINYTGEDLLKFVCKKLRICNHKYFGLKYLKKNNSKQWLMLDKTIKEQIESSSQLFRLKFRLKYYPPYPYLIGDPSTKYHIFLQLQLDLLQGKLFCETHRAAEFLALIIQHIYGDYDPVFHTDDYIDFKVIQNQSKETEKRAMRIHQTKLKSLNLPEVEHRFLKMACYLDSYGVEPHLVSNVHKKQYFIGCNYTGIKLFMGRKLVRKWNWLDVKKLSYVGNSFLMDLISNDVVSFTCPSEDVSKFIWKNAIEQLVFFTDIIIERENNFITKLRNLKSISGQNESNFLRLISHNTLFTMASSLWNFVLPGNDMKFNYGKNMKKKRTKLVNLKDFVYKNRNELLKYISFVVTLSIVTFVAGGVSELNNENIRHTINKIKKIDSKKNLLQIRSEHRSVGLDEDSETGFMYKPL